MANFDNGPVIKPVANQAIAQDTKLTTNTNVTLPPANAAIQNAISAVAKNETRVASLNSEGLPVFALGVAPAAKPDSRTVRQIAQDEAGDFRALGKRHLG